MVESPFHIGYTINPRNRQPRGFLAVLGSRLLGLTSLTLFAFRGIWKPSRSFGRAPGRSELEIRNSLRYRGEMKPHRKRYRRRRVPCNLSWPAFALLFSLSALLGCDGQGTGPNLDATAADRVEVSLARVFLMQGLGWDLTAAAYTKGGLPTTRSVEWSTSDARVARVDKAGRVTAVAPGHATVTARLDRASGTVEVRVVDDWATLPFTSDGPFVVVPETSWTLRGEGLGGLAVNIGWVVPAVEVTGDSIAMVRVPALDAFGPCLPPSLPVAVETEEWVAVVSASGSVPFDIEIARGDRAVLDVAVEHGCEITAPAGEYLVAAVVVDHAGALQAGRLVRDSVTLDVWSEDPGAAGVHLTPEARMPTPGAGPPDLIPPPSVRPSPAGASRESAQACPIASTVGDSVLLPSGRDQQGRYDWGAPTTDEWWYLVAQAPHLNLVVDSAGARVWASDSYVRTELSAIMEMYETEWVPIWDELYEDPLPDRDGNGRMIMRSAWNSAVGGGGGNGTYAQADCPGGWRPGEEFYVPVDVFSDDPDRAPAYLRAYHRAVVQHEAGHTHDLARRYAAWGGHTYTSQVAAEGIASFFTTYWLLRKQGSPLLGNHDPSDVASVLDGLYFEPGAWQIYPDISNTYEWTAWAEAGGYGQSVQFITWVAAQAVQAGKPVASVLTGLVRGSDARTTYGSIYRDATGEMVSDAEVLTRWGLSWIVDDRMEDPPPELTIPTWNTEAAYQGRPEGPRPGPDVVLNGPARAVLAMGEPSVAVIELKGTGPHRFGISVTNTGAADGLHVQILRTR